MREFQKFQMSKNHNFNISKFKNILNIKKIQHYKIAKSQKFMFYVQIFENKKIQPYPKSQIL